MRCLVDPGDGGRRWRWRTGATSLGGREAGVERGAGGLDLPPGRPAEFAFPDGGPMESARPHAVRREEVTFEGAVISNPYYRDFLFPAQRGPAGARALPCRADRPDGGGDPEPLRERALQPDPAGKAGGGGGRPARPGLAGGAVGRGGGGSVREAAVVDALRRGPVGAVRGMLRGLRAGRARAGGRAAGRRAALRPAGGGERRGDLRRPPEQRDPAGRAALRGDRPRKAPEPDPRDGPLRALQLGGGLPRLDVQRLRPPERVRGQPDDRGRRWRRSRK